MPTKMCKNKKVRRDGWAPGAVALTIHRFGLFVLVAGCASTPSAPADPNLLAFLDSGRVTRADVTRHLGIPSATFEADHVVTYRLSGGNAGYSLVSQSNGWESVDYGLVLLFDADDQLKRHALIDIRPSTAR